MVARILSLLLFSILLHQFLPTQRAPTPKQGRNGKWGYADAHGKWLVRPRYVEVDSASEGFLSVTKAEGKHRYLNLEGKRAWGRAKFGEARPFKNGMAAVKAHPNGNWGFIDTTGALKVKYSFEAANDFDQYGFAFCHPENSNSIGVLIDKQAKQVVFNVAGIGPYDPKGRMMVKVTNYDRMVGYQYFSGPERKLITERYTTPSCSMWTASWSRNVIPGAEKG